MITENQDPPPLDIEALLHQHDKHTFSIDAGEVTHKRVINHYLQNLNEKSCLHNTCSYLSPLSYTRSWQFAAIASLLYLGTMIIFFSLNGTRRWGTYLDNSHWSDGAPPSILQQRKDLQQALEYTGMIFGLSPLAFIIMTFVIYHHIDRPRFIYAYQQFCLTMEIPSYSELDIKKFFSSITHHVEFLLKKKIENGVLGVALMLTDLQKNLIDKRDDFSNEVNNGKSQSQAPQFDPSYDEGSSSTDQHATRTLGEFNLDISEAEINGEDRNFLKEISAAVATHDAALRIIHSIDRSVVNLVIIPRGADIYKRIERLERAFAQLTNKPSIDRLNALERLTDRKEFQHLKKEIQDIKKELLIDKKSFIPLLVFNIRKKMSQNGIRVSIKERALFLNALLDANYYRNNPLALNLILYIFFNYCQTTRKCYEAERLDDIKTFLLLNDSNKAKIIDALNQCGTIGQQQAAVLLDRKELSNRSQRKMLSFWIKNKKRSGLSAAVNQLSERLINEEQASNALDLLSCGT